MEGPLSVFEDWFTELPPDVRTDVVALALMHLPGIDVPQESLLDEDIVAPALAWLEHVACEDDPYSQVATALSIRAAIDFFVIRTRGTSQSWNEIERVNLTAKADIRGLGNGSDFVDRFLEQLPLRRKQWLRTAEQWADLRSTAWSDETLSQWLDSQTPSLD